MNFQIEAIVILIRTALCMPAQATPEAHRFVTDLLPESSSSTLQMAGELCADLAEIRHGAIGLSRALKGIGDLVSACFSVLDIEPVAELRLLELVNEFSGHLSQSPRYESEFSVSPSKKDNVLIYFLAHTRKELSGEIRLNDASERWTTLCYLGYCGTRIGLSSSLATQQFTESDESSAAYGQVDHQAMESARAIELFIKYVPLAKFNGQIPTIVAPKLLNTRLPRSPGQLKGLRGLKRPSDT